MYTKQKKKRESIYYSAGDFGRLTGTYSATSKKIRLPEYSMASRFRENIDITCHSSDTGMFFVT